MMLLPEVGPLVAARSYLIAALEQRNIILPVGVTPPLGEPRPYALLSRPGGNSRGPFLNDYMIRVRVFDTDAVQLETNTELLHRLMLSANHHRVETPAGPVWITGARSQMGPLDYTGDDSIPLWGMQFAVYWTIGLRPER
jgi:hypothetical protein